MAAELTVEYCGQAYLLAGDRALTIGRDARFVRPDHLPLLEDGARAS